MRNWTHKIRYRNTKQKWKMKIIKNNFRIHGLNGLGWCTAMRLNMCSECPSTTAPLDMQIVKIKNWKIKIIKLKFRWKDPKPENGWYWKWKFAKNGKNKFRFNFGHPSPLRGKFIPMNIYYQVMVNIESILSGISVPKCLGT